MIIRPRTPRPKLPRPVWLLSWTSLFTDTASETVYPIMPLYLTKVLGASAISIGIIEGLAEALNSVLKIWSGRFSDRWNTRKPFVLAGYGLSSAVRPLVAFASTWTQVLAVRLTDRVGKGVRTAPRDALLAAWSEPATRGYVFGLHRSMDHLGAVIGPVLASLFLWAFPEQYRTLFLLTIVPGALAVYMLTRVPDVVRASPPAATATTIATVGPATVLAPVAPPAPIVPGAGGTSAAEAPLGRNFWRYLAVVFVFSLGNSTDAFLLLRLSDVGVATAWIPMTWAALHVVKATVSPIAGHLSDRMSRKWMIALGWVVYAAVYFGFAAVTSRAVLLALFLTYGFYFGLTEGVEKAVVADMAPTDARGTAFGYYHAVVGVGALAASLLFGVIWKFAGAPVAFGVGAALALASAALLAPLRLARDL